jgi:hypothetical protein
VPTTRKRLENRRTYRREIAEDDTRPRAVRVTHHAKDVVVEVHVHNELAPVDVAADGEDQYMPVDRRPRVEFNGDLFSWREHYDPLFRKIIPMVEEQRSRRRQYVAVIARLTLWGSVVAALTTLGCNVFR